ncbi:hypothetical protein JHK85_006417 [Glycine max]|nr:hypothetical protein JHK85_006417 [Glycine max]
MSSILSFQFLITYSPSSNSLHHHPQEFSTKTLISLLAQHSTIFFGVTLLRDNTQ